MATPMTAMGVREKEDFFLEKWDCAIRPRDCETRI